MNQTIGGERCFVGVTIDKAEDIAYLFEIEPTPCEAQKGVSQEAV